MDYKQYHEAYFKLIKVKNKIKKINQKIENIILELVSTTSKLKDEPVSTNSNQNKILELTSQKIDLEKKREYLKELLAIRTQEKNQAELELKASKDYNDIIYYSYFINHKRVKDIAREIAFTREYTYDLLHQIKIEKRKIEKKIQKK